MTKRDYIKTNNGLIEGRVILNQKLK